MRLLTLILFFGTFLFTVSAQDTSTEEAKPEPPRVRFGVGIFGNSGFALMNYGDLQKDFDKANSLNQDSIKFFMRGLNSTHSVNLELMIGKRIMLRGGMAFLRSDASETARGQVKVRSNLIGGSLGFAVINKNRWLGYPFLGFYSNSQKMLVKNYAAEQIYFGDALIDRNETATFKTQLNMLEVGIGTKYVIPKANNVIVGMELGGYFSLGDGEWKTSDGNPVGQVSKASMKGGYLRVSMGLGYYKYGEATPKASDNEDIEVEKAEKKPKKETKEKEKKAEKKNKAEKPKKDKKKKDKKKKEEDDDDIF